MSSITIEVWDATGNKKQLVELPADAPVNRVIAVLVEKMNLPRHSPDGQMMSYKFHHKATGRQLADNQTLEASEVKNGDVLRLQPEITAGGDLSAIRLQPDVSGALLPTPAKPAPGATGGLSARAWDFQACRVMIWLGMAASARAGKLPVAPSISAQLLRARDARLNADCFENYSC